MDKLKVLPQVSRLSDHVLRILGQNPGKFTLQGTNTYLLGRQNPYILIDTGEGREEYPQIFESALRDVPRSEDKTQPMVSDIIITHRHHDHYGGLPSVLRSLRKTWDELNPPSSYMPPRLHKYPLPPDASDAKLQSLLDSLPPGSFVPAPTGPLHDLSESQTLSSTDASVQVLHTPGHTTDSICLFFTQEKALFTADTILGQGTAVFEDLSAYIASLQKLLDFAKQSGRNYAIIYPGHGPVVEDGPQLIDTYIQHRLEREDEIMQVLKSPAPAEDDGVWTLWAIVAIIYKAYPENLWAPAAHGVGLHLKKLEREGRVRSMGGEGITGKWQFCRL